MAALIYFALLYQCIIASLYFRSTAPIRDFMIHGADRARRVIVLITDFSVARDFTFVERRHKRRCGASAVWRASQYLPARGGFRRFTPSLADFIPAYIEYRHLYCALML